MANFHNIDDDLIDKAFEYPCVYEDIYILGLKEGEVLISYNPSFMQNTNGMLIGIDSRFTHFYVVNSIGNIIKNLQLNWETECLIDDKLPINSVNYVPIIISGIGLVCIIICLLIKRRKK